MKRYSIPFLLLIAFLVSCGSSRRAASVSSSNKNVVNIPTQVSIPVTKPKEQRKTPEQMLVWRLDSLLMTEDSLLTQSQLGLHVVDLTTGKVLYAHGEQQRMRPASTEKVVTAVCALDLLGPSYTLNTQLFATGNVSGGTLQGDIYIKGVMDPLLSESDVRDMVQQLKNMGVQRITGRIVSDASFKDSDEYGWGWCWDDKNPVLSPLLCGGKPGLAAELKKALQKAGVKVGNVVAGMTPANARELISLRRPLTTVLEPMLKESDNLCAESVFYQMGSNRKVVATRMQPLLNEEVTVADGSGLSLYNYQTPEGFTKLLAYAAARPDSIYNPLLKALPIASIDGTLKNRMGGTAAEIAVRAKTGTVTAVSTLVGYTTQRCTNHLIAFAIMNQGVRRGADGRAFQDKVCILISE